MRSICRKCPFNFLKTTTFSKYLKWPKKSQFFISSTRGAIFLYTLKLPKRHLSAPSGTVYQETKIRLKRRSFEEHPSVYDGLQFPIQHGLFKYQFRKCKVAFYLGAVHKSQTHMWDLVIRLYLHILVNSVPLLNPPE